jgi:hypothetical protein
MESTNVAALRAFFNSNVSRPVDGSEFMEFFKGLSVGERQEFGDSARAMGF